MYDELVKDLQDAFGRLGFKDAWMAEDISITVEEKMRSEDGQQMTREDVDVLVTSLLKASGFQDVAREYAASRGNDPFQEERRNLKQWTDGTLNALLARSLPLNSVQLQEISAKCKDALRVCGLELATDRFIIGLALHLLLNQVQEISSAVQEDISTLKIPNTRNAVPCQDDDKGICRVMPYSTVFPRARVQIDLKKLAEQNGGWISSMMLAAPLAKIAPAIIEKLHGIRKEVVEKYPMLSDSPCSIVITGIAEKDTAQTIIPILNDTVIANLPFKCIVIFR